LHRTHRGLFAVSANLAFRHSLAGGAHFLQPPWFALPHPKINLRKAVWQQPHAAGKPRSPRFPAIGTNYPCKSLLLSLMLT
jgi:hypothetical protein